MEPGKPILEVDTGKVDRLPDGRLRFGVHAIIHPDDLGRYGEGRRCLNCHQDQKEANPKKCWVCGFEIRKRQLETLQREMREEEWDGVHRKEAEEADDFQAQNEKFRWERQGAARVFRG